MAKRIIAIDLDDVIVETAQSVLDDYFKKYGIRVPLTDFYSHDFTGVWGAPDHETAVKRVNDFLGSSEYYHSKPIEEAIDTIRWLNNYHELHIVTGRPSLVEEATLQWLELHFADVFETVVFTNYFMRDKNGAQMRTKGDVCVELGASILIDDNLDHARSVSDAGIDVLLFGDYPWNQAKELPRNVKRVDDWTAVKEYFDVSF